MAHVSLAPLEGMSSVSASNAPIGIATESMHCSYCGRSNSINQKYCGEGTVHGCGAQRDDKGKLGNLAGMMRGEPVYIGRGESVYIGSPESETLAGMLRGELG